MPCFVFLLRKPEAFYRLRLAQQRSKKCEAKKKQRIASYLGYA
jgi:hypothetical protein